MLIILQSRQYTANWKSYTCIYMHIRICTVEYVSYTACQYLIRTLQYVCSILIYIWLIYVHILHQLVFARIYSEIHACTGMQDHWCKEQRLKTRLLCECLCKTRSSRAWAPGPRPGLRPGGRSGRLQGCLPRQSLPSNQYRPRESINSSAMQSIVLQQ